MTPNKFTHAGLDWHPHTPGDPMPCPGDTMVRVLLRSDFAALCDCTNYETAASVWDWGACPTEPMAEVVGWHPIEDQPITDPAETHRRAVEWHGLTDAGLRLRLGELTAQEIRTVRAVLNAIVAEETTN